MNDCPFKDDEFNCILNDYICPESCSCWTFAISCGSVYTSLPNHLILLQRMIFILLIGNTFISNFPWFFYLYNVKILNIHKFKLPDICNTFHQSLNKYSSLFALDISQNQITVLRSHCLHFQGNMLLLNISENNIINIEELTFSNLTKLQVLDLGGSAPEALTVYSGFLGDVVLLLNVSS